MTGPKHSTEDDDGGGTEAIDGRAGGYYRHCFFFTVRSNSYFVSAPGGNVVSADVVQFIYSDLGVKTGYTRHEAKGKEHIAPFVPLRIK